MRWLEAADLPQIYGAPGATSIRKVADHVTAEYAAMLDAARFCVLATVGPRGVDASPRGDDGPVARLIDPRHVALPDWKGNDRIDSISNIVADGRASLIFLVRGSGNALRLRGLARVTDDADLRASFARDGKEPRAVIVLQVREAYFQCARAVLRAGLWDGADDSAGLPTPGEILAALTMGEVGGETYDAEWPERAARSMW
ncbi:MAG TPA: MSMEG_1061 family FMN-dependent PPOX-type flavoprotein [Paracoccus sp. (in: a-proteobacteria)]|uniref:MSMEG_1061 family FMN-dependent PPOX-type flavoprotein n=1 Tax=Paracoccus sp. TaxID=267 RepID=UPI002C0B932D|nr:MSMEG_1061 family FMN-dependent PPOX-type flavoprotein [Paracoccus sp. (in: a-proteobacteria)]HWL56636.1 MSMEG_1061 family FMN-dependent PPOX-type flavoprotein [Paracoccus sp. (in: a-proteobacteria)]